VEVQRNVDILDHAKLREKVPDVLLCCAFPNVPHQERDPRCVVAFGFVAPASATTVSSTGRRVIPTPPPGRRATVVVTASAGPGARVEESVHAETESESEA